MMTEKNEQRWWYCRSCFAVNDGNDGTKCWNCGYVQRATKNFPWVEMGKEKCRVCGKSYVTWTLPAGTTMTEPDVLGLCMHYFEHHGDNAYFPPMLPLAFILEGNGWHYNEKTNKVVKNRR